MSDNNNKSLYIYTALIFVVALVLIIISFFGQSKINQKQPIPVSQEQVNSITERAAVVSKENKTLLEENANLKQQLSEEKHNLVELRAQIEIYKKSNENTKLLLSANSYASDKKYDEAKTALEAIAADMLSADEQIIYNNVKKAIENAEK